jgi:hypothetical protein
VAGITIDTKAFGRELARYLTVARKDAATVLNTKAFFITLTALWNTPKVPSSKIERELGRAGSPRARVPQPHGRRTTHHRRTSVRGRPTIANLIVQARRRKAGEKGLKGAALAEATRKFIGKRKRSRAFLASGWVPAVAALANYVDAAQRYKGGRSASRNGDVRIYGRNKGSAIPADANKQGANLTAAIVNSVTPSGPRSSQAEAVMRRALQEAIDKEMASMAEYFDKKMQARAQDFNAR